MTAHDPREPAEEPDGDATAKGAADVPRDEDALWAAIVENYGERAELADPEVEVPPSPRSLVARPDPEAEEDPERDDPESHFVPPPPPPVPRTTPVRTLAWIGLFGVPAFVLICLVARVTLPPWLGLLLMGWFVGGFVFLVASMKPDERDGYDDGAVL